MSSRWGFPLLPRKEGNISTWLAVSQRPIAVVSDQWPEPKLLLDPASLATDIFTGQPQPRLHFYHLDGWDPDFVFSNATTKLFQSYQ